MDVKEFALSMGLGAAVGAVAVMMLPRQNPARKFISQTAQKVEDAAVKVTDKISDELDL